MLSQSIDKRAAEEEQKELAQYALLAAIRALNEAAQAQAADKTPSFHLI
jgi:hypothetical protein